MRRLQHYIILSLCLLLINNGIQAQLPANRTRATVIADVLAEMPAKNQKHYNQVIADLVSTGEEGLLDLIGRMNPPGSESNEIIDFAITGWTHYAATDISLREMTANAFQKALTQTLDKEVKAFVIRQLRTIAINDNVGVLSSFLNDDYLAPTAAMALISIGSDDANEALLTALKSAQSESHRINLINALSQTGYEAAETTLLGILNEKPSGELKRVAMNALANIGTKEAVKVLGNAAKNADFSYEKNNATASYLTLLDRLNVNDPAFVTKEAKRLLKDAGKSGKQDIKTAATRLLLNNPSAKTHNILKNVLKDGNITYLTGVLNSFPFQDNPKAVALILKQFKSTKSPELQTALLYWMANNKIGNISAFATPLIASSYPMVQKAASISLAKGGEDKALIALGSMLKSDDEKTVALAKNALATFDGDISQTLASVFDTSKDAGKIAILELIADRKMESQYNLVYNQLQTDNDAVKKAAANTLKDVVTDKNISDLFKLLEQPGQSNIPAINQAINVALSSLSPEEQVEVVTNRMNSSQSKHLYYSALANSGSTEALKIITKAYNNANGDEKESAFEAIAGWKSFDVIYSLLDIARNSSNKQELTKVTSALISTINKDSRKTGAIRYLYAREAMQFAQTDKQRNELLLLIGSSGQYQALLFVAPYMDYPALSETAAQAAMNIAINNPSFAGEETTAILNKVSKTLSNPDADYQRQSIAKYLSENSTEGGFVSIFNGKNLDGWKGLVSNPIKRAAMSEKELSEAQKIANEKAAKDWKVVDGNIVFDGSGNNNLCTEKQYGDFEMLVDWKLYPGPEPDAGIYLRGSPQVQIWDTARVKAGAQVGSGGLYNNRVHPSKPLKVVDEKLGEWNTFRIIMKGDRVSVWLNGELVTDNIILENYWNRDLPIFPIEQIELQAHGSKVAYRDIFIKEIERPKPFTLSAEEEKEGFEILFDGTNMHHWTGNTTDYTIQDGLLTVNPKGGKRGGARNLYTKKQYDNFVFRFEFMLTPGANNGLGIRTPMEGDAAYVGMELQILDNDAPAYKDLQIYQYHGSVYGVIPAERGHLKPIGEWNYQEVIADGDNITIILNGTTILDGNIREASKNGTMDKKDHPGLLNKSGHIGFLGHGSKLKFRNIRIKEL